MAGGSRLWREGTVCRVRPERAVNIQPSTLLRATPVPTTARATATYLRLLDRCLSAPRACLPPTCTAITVSVHLVTSFPPGAVCYSCTGTGCAELQRRPPTAVSSCSRLPSLAHTRARCVSPGGPTDIKPLSKFEHTGLPPTMLHATRDFASPSPIQAQCWPIILSGRDLIGIAATGGCLGSRGQAFRECRPMLRCGSRGWVGMQLRGHRSI